MKGSTNPGGRMAGYAPISAFPASRAAAASVTASRAWIRVSFWSIGLYTGRMTRDARSTASVGWISPLCRPAAAKTSRRFANGAPHERTI